MFLQVANNKIAGTNCISYSELGVDYRIENIEVKDEIYEEYLRNENSVIYHEGKIIKDPEYEIKLLGKMKEEKRQEALQKAYEWQEEGFVEYKNARFEFSINNRDNLRDTYEALLALGETSTLWNDKDDNIIELSLEDIQYIRLNLILNAIKRIWIEDYPEYSRLIESARNKEELRGIVIDYSRQKEDTQKELEE